MFHPQGCGSWNLGGSIAAQRVTWWSRTEGMWLDFFVLWKNILPYFDIYIYTYIYTYIYIGETLKIYGCFNIYIYYHILPINQQLQQLQQLSLTMTCGKPDTPRPSPQRGLGHTERSGGAARGAAAGSHVWHWDVADRSARALPCAGTLCRSNAGMGWIYGWYHI